MPDFIPVNRLEIQLRAVLRDPRTPLWDFYTPLAAAPLWVIVRHYPELDGSDLVAPGGGNPEVCTFGFPDGKYIGLYTAPERIEAIFAKWQLSRADWTPLSAPGYDVLRWLHGSESKLCVNCGLADAQKGLDPDMIDILLERPAPVPESPGAAVLAEPAGDPARFLGPLHDFLAGQPSVRAAWLMDREAAAAAAPGRDGFEILLFMRDPEDRSLLDQVDTIARALTPVEMECSVAVGMADEASLRQLAQRQPPFYRAPDFLG